MASADAEDRGQVHDELAARAGAGALHAHGPAVGGDQVLHDGEAEPEPAGGTVEGLGLLHEQIEHAIEQVRPDADSVIPDADLHAVPGRLRRDVDRAARIAVLGSIREQVREDLLEARRVAVDEEVVGDVEIERLLPVLEQRLRGLDCAPHDFADRSPLLVELDLSAGDPRDVEQVVHQPEQLLQLTIDDQELLRVHAALLHQLDGHHDRRKGISELVTQHGQELVLCARRVLRRAASFDRALEQLAAQLGEGEVHLHARDQLARGERLDEVVVCTRLKPLDARLLSRARGQHDHRNVARRFGRAQSRDQAEAVEIRHHDVREDHVGTMVADGGEGDLAVDGRLDGPIPGEHARQVFAHVGVVVHHEDASRQRSAVRTRRGAELGRSSAAVTDGEVAFGSHRSASSTNRLSLGWAAIRARSCSEARSSRARRNDDGHRGAHARRAPRRHVAAEDPRELVHQRQPDARPFLGARTSTLHAMESIEDMR